VTGGWDPSLCLEGGIDDTYIFDPEAGEWLPGPRMREARYYPSNLPMPDGSTLIFSGYNESCGLVGSVEVFEPGTGKIHRASEQVKFIDFYPQVHLLSSGKVAHVGPGPVSSIYDPATGKWQTVARTNLSLKRYFGTSFEIPGQQDKIMICGGYEKTVDTPTATCEVIDFAASTPAWKPAPTMHYPRAHLNPVILPDGKVLIVGGGYWYDYDAPVHNAELYDPATNRWKLLPPQRYGRMYHSSALLLPDGRVISSGQDEHRHGEHLGQLQSGDWAELYSPRYLFRGKRPKILDAPAVAGYGEQVRVKVTKAKKIRSAVLIAPSAVTHATNLTQRLIRLDFEHEKNKFLQVAMPDAAEAEAPGYYMLFLLNAKDVPTEAAWVRLEQR
jgi:hypothetical protein